MTSFLLRQVRIVPLDSKDIPEPVDVMVKDGVIAEIGSLRRPRGFPEVAGNGRWIIPGLWDAHVHLGQWALTRRRLDLSGTKSPEEVLALVAQAAQSGRPVIGSGQRAGTWAREVTVAELDEVSGQVPVVLVNGDFHHGWLNTAALDALGLPRRNSPVAESEWFAAYPRVAILEGSARSTDYQQVLHDAAALGVVGLVDFEFDAPWTDWAQRWHEGCDVMRIRWSPYASQLDSVRAAGLRSRSSLAGADVGLTVGSLKIISDGSLGARTAWCREPYADTGGFGAPNQTAGELVALMTGAREAGLSVATHAIGDQALEVAVAAYEAVGVSGSIEHAELATTHAIDELRRLKLTASVQPAHLLDDWQTAERVWADRVHRCFTFRSMLDYGVRLALGSDAPVSPLDPWLSIDAAVHRARPGDDSWHAEQGITPAQAIAASVDDKRIAVGQTADVVLLDYDPLVSDAVTLREMRVALTCVAGSVVHSYLEL
jgi:hypothetical protein